MPKPYGNNWKGTSRQAQDGASDEPLKVQKPKKDELIPPPLRRCDDCVDEAKKLKKTDPEAEGFKKCKHRASPKFYQAVKFWVACEEAPLKKRKRADLVQKLCDTWRNDVSNDLYPIIRLTLPSRDLEFRTFGLKEDTLAKAIVAAESLDKNSVDAKKLLSWKRPDATSKAAGEFSSIAHEFYQSRCTIEDSRGGNMTIDDVNDVLRQLHKLRKYPHAHNAANKGNASDARGKGKGKGDLPLAEQRGDILRRCRERMSALELKWLCRIILKDMRCGMSEKTVLKGFHEDAESLFNTCSDIKRVCYVLWDPNYHLPKENVFVKPGQTYQPMFSQPLVKDFKACAAKLKENRPGPPMGLTGESLATYKKHGYDKDEFIMEEKLDGERMQMHKIGDTYMWSSRRAKDYTQEYGADPKSGSIVPFIQDAFGGKVEEIILDGEMRVWDPSRGKYQPFGNLKTYSTKTKFEEMDPRPCYTIFDILWVKFKGQEGVNLLNDQLWNRKMALLDIIVNPVEHVFELLEVKRGRTGEDIRAYFEQVLDEKGEGLVIKNPGSRYVLSGRTKSWVKVKPDYMDAMGEHIDAQVMGAYWGTGKRGKGHGSFLVGVLDTKKEADGEPVYHTLCKVGSGFNAELFREMQEYAGDYWEDVDKKASKKDNRGLPGWFHTVDEYPDQWIHPSRAPVLQVKAAEIVPSVEFGMGYCLRFPRAMSVRKDKDSAITVSEFHEQRRHTHSVTTVLAQKANPKKRTRTATHTLTGYRHGKITVSDKLFEGWTVYIQTTSDGLVSKAPGFRGAEVRNPDTGKKELERIFATHGGEFVHLAPPRDPYGDKRAIITVPANLPYFHCRAFAVQKRGEKVDGKLVDLVHANWILDSVKAGRVLPRTQKYYVQVSEATKASEEYQQEEEEFEDEKIVDAKAEDDEASEAEDGYDNPDAPRRPPEADSDGETDNGSEGSDGSGSDLSDDENEKPEIPSRVATPDVAQESSFVFASPVKMEVDEEGDPATEDEEDPATEEEDEEPEPARYDRLKADKDEMDYSADKLFHPLIIYLDTHKNARRNGLEASTRSAERQAQEDTEVEKAGQQLMANFGTVVDDLDHADLTHIVSPADVLSSRYKELLKRTAKPAYRHIVAADWVSKCVDDKTLAPESDFKPSSSD